MSGSPRTQRTRQAAERFAATPLVFATTEAWSERHRVNNWRDVVVFIGAVGFVARVFYAFN